MLVAPHSPVGQHVYTTVQQQYCSAAQRGIRQCYRLHGRILLCVHTVQYKYSTCDMDLSLIIDPFLNWMNLRRW